MHCSKITVTWYPGAVGSTDDPLVLLSPTHHVPGPGMLETLVEQLVQGADYSRASDVANFARGNRRRSLTIEEWREFTLPDLLEAHEDALALSAGLPALTGWLLIELEGRDTTWSLANAVIRGLRTTMDERQGILKLIWEVTGGALAVYSGESPPTIWPGGEVIAGPVSTNRGAILRGPNRIYPAP